MHTEVTPYKIDYVTMRGALFTDLHILLKDWDFPKTPDNYEDFYDVIQHTTVIGLYRYDILEAAIILSNHEDSPNIIWIDVCASNEIKGKWATRKLFSTIVEVVEEQGKTHLGLEAVNPISASVGLRSGFKHVDRDVYLININEFKKIWRL